MKNNHATGKKYPTYVLICPLTRVNDHPHSQPNTNLNALGVYANVYCIYIYIVELWKLPFCLSLETSIILFVYL
jgi:hypothetical protein